MSVLEFRIEPDVSRVRFLRADIRGRLEELGLGEQDVDRLVLVVDEIVSNSIEHGRAYRRPADLLELRLTVAVDHVAVEFHDPAVPPETVAEIVRMIERCRAGAPPLDNERGRGLFLIDDGLDALQAVPAAGGPGLWLTGRLRRRSA